MSLADDAWLAGHAPCPGCPHPHYLLAHQRIPAPLRKSPERAMTDPWNLEAFRAAHPALIGAERALAWLHQVFGAKARAGRHARELHHPVCPMCRGCLEHPRCQMLRGCRCAEPAP
jgi:hypothetical protein